MGISIEFASSILTLLILIFASAIVFYLKDKKQENISSGLKIESNEIVFITPDGSSRFYLKITNESNYHKDLCILTNEEATPTGWSIHLSEINFSLEPNQSIKIDGYLGMTEEIGDTHEENIKLYVYSTESDRKIDKTIPVRTSTHGIDELERWRNGWKELIDYVNNFHENLDQKISRNLFGAYGVCKNFVDIYQEISSKYGEVILGNEKDEFMKKLKHCCHIIDEHIKTSEHSSGSHDFHD